MEQAGSRGREAESLLRAAWNLARDAENGDSDVSIQVTIKSAGSWIVDTTGGMRDSSPAESSRARLHLSYASADVFLDLAHKRIDPRAALLTGKLSFKGDMSLAIKLRKWISQAAEEQAAAIGAELEVAEREKWEKDEDAQDCAVCRQPFTVFRRRHHCRFCGRVVCDNCSAAKIDGRRACEPCRGRADAARAAGIAKTASTRPEDGGRDRPSAPQGDVEHLQTRVLDLEEQVETLDRRAFTARALVLRQLVLCVYRLMVLSLFGLVLLATHFAAIGVSRNLGPNLIEVSVDVDISRLSAFIRSSPAKLAAAAGVGVASAEAAVSNASVALDEEGDDEGTSGSMSCSTCDDGYDRGFLAGGEPRTLEEGGMTKDDFCLEDHGGEEYDLGSFRDNGAVARMTAEQGTSGQQQQQQQQQQHSQEQQQRTDDATPASRKPRLTLSTYWVVMLMVMVCIRERLRRTEGLVLRRVKTFCLAGTAIFTLKMTKKMTKGMNQADSEETWADAHKLLAPYMYHSILDIAGMWVKTGQYLSSRADVMPQPYLDELSKLQDSVPASSYEEMEETVQQQLGRPLSELFASIEREALASASVAQVHRCTLKDGREAVIKIQHRRVRQLFLEDLGNIRRLVEFVAWAEKEYDFRPIMNEWASESNKELDFFCEAKNLVRINTAMKRSGLDVIVPELVPEFTRTKVMVMTFCAGFKVTDTKALAASELDRDGVMQAVTESFAYQIHIDGLFNGDPHPGNILLQARDAPAGVEGSGGEKGRGEGKSALPVLLDWGLAKTLPERLRIAFSRFVYSASEHDFVSMLQSFEEMGLKLNRFDPAEDMHNIRFMLRDTQPASESRADVARFHGRIRKKRKRGVRSPVDAYPGDLLFFLRVTELLKGLATRLNVRQKYMGVMAPYAKRALQEIVPEAERATQAIYPSPLLSPLEAKVRKAVEELVERGQVTGCQVCVIYRGKTLVDLCAGTQGPVDLRPVRPTTLFCVFSAGKAVCSTAIHLLADRGLIRYDQRVAELWPEFARNGKEATTIRHVLTHSTGLQHTFPDRPTFDSVCDWEAAQIVLEEASPAWPPGSRASYHYFTFGWLVAALVEKASGVPFEEFVRTEIAAPLRIEDSFFMGRLRARGVEEARIASVEYAFKLPGTGDGGGSSGEGSSAVSPSASVPPATQRGGISSKERAETGPPTSSAGVAEPDEVVGIEDSDGVASEGGEASAGILGVLASALKESDPEEGAAVEVLARKLAGREYFLDPRVFNHRQMQEACIPAANGHFTAKALATMYDSFLQSLGLSSGQEHARGQVGAGGVPPPLLSRARVNEMRVFQVTEKSALHLMFGLPARAIRYALGYQMFGFQEKAGRQQQQTRSANMSSTSSTSSFTTNARAGELYGRANTAGATAGGEIPPPAATPALRGRVRLSGFGQVGMGGSVALCDPASGLAFAMVTNKVQTGRKSSSSILSIVSEELGIGDPSHFFED